MSQSLNSGTVIRPSPRRHSAIIARSPTPVPQFETLGNSPPSPIQRLEVASQTNSGRDIPIKFNFAVPLPFDLPTSEVDRDRLKPATQPSSSSGLSSPDLKSSSSKKRKDPNPVIGGPEQLKKRRKRY